MTTTGCNIKESKEDVVTNTTVVEQKHMDYNWELNYNVDNMVKEVEKVEAVIISENDAVVLAKMAWGEARGCSDMEVAATMWCVLNRVDNSGKSVIEVITAPGQFYGYSENHPVDERLYKLAVDVLTRWENEKQGLSPEESGRVLPKGYLFFHGSNGQNHFRDQYNHDNAIYWDWSYPNPYEAEVN